MLNICHNLPYFVLFPPRRSTTTHILLKLHISHIFHTHTEADFPRPHCLSCLLCAPVFNSVLYKNGGQRVLSIAVILCLQFPYMPMYHEALHNSSK